MTATATRLKAPFPYFGGKSGAAELIWSRFGDTPNYVEPFAGSLAVLLGRPHAPKTETVNDLDGLLSNAWRAIRTDPEAVAFYADQPVVEVDLTARHLYLVNAREGLTERLMADPDYCDAKAAGWWIWGACNWIGSGWCSGEGPWRADNGLLVKREGIGVRRKLPRLCSASAGVNPGVGGGGGGAPRKLPHLGDAGKGVSRQLPHLGNAGKGVSRQLPHLGNAGAGDSRAGIGVNRKVPYLASAGIGVINPRPNPGLYDWMTDLSTRLRRTRICCGDWSRVLGDSVTTKHGLTAVLLDPPYAAADADNDVYGSAYDSNVAAAVRQWAIENGSNPLLRIALCGYEQEMPEGWVCAPWKAKKGYQSVNEDGSHNGHREVIHFSPHCLRPDLDKRIALF